MNWSAYYTIEIMIIGIDARTLTLSFHDGTRHYAEQLLLALSQIDHNNEYVLFTGERTKFISQKNFREVSVPFHMPILKRQALLTWAVNNEHVDVFHYLDPFGFYFLHHPKIICTIHDLNLNAVYDGTHRLKPLIDKAYSSLLMESVLRKTRVFLADTEFTRGELREHVAPYHQWNKMIVIPLACHEDFKGTSSRFINKPNHFMCMGDFSPRKNIPRVIESYSLLPRYIQNVYRLTIVISTAGPKRDFIREAKAHSVLSYVDIIENPSRHDLVRLYSEALVFLYPSLYEGFGIPILEAMSCGCPVITSNRGAMKETSGDAAILIHPESVREMVDAMVQCCDMSRRQILIRKGKRRADQFSWESTAVQTLRAYTYLYNMPS